MTKSIQTKENNVPRIFFEILIYGTNKHKKKTDKTFDELKSQISKRRGNKHKVRALWYIDSGEKTNQQKILWLIDNAKCKYYIILNANNDVPKNYVKDALFKIKEFEKSFDSLKSANVCVAQKSNKKIEIAKSV